MDGRPKRQTKRNEHVELGKKYHIDPRTAKRYAESPQKPEYTLSEPKPTKMDPYKQIVDEWLEEAPYSALRILEKLREMGFSGADYCDQIGCSLITAVNGRSCNSCCTIAISCNDSININCGNIGITGTPLQ